MPSTDMPYEWDSGTAYDFFVSLSVLHDPEKFGLRGSWAAGVRSRLPASEREILQRAVNFIWPLHWVYTLPSPKDAPIALRSLRSVAPDQRLLDLHPRVPEDVLEFWLDIAGRKSWSHDDLKRMMAIMQADKHTKVTPASLRKAAGDILDLWADAVAVGEGLLSALECYYDSFYAEEEARIKPFLDQSLVRAQTLAASLPLPELLEELSQGVRLEKDWGQKTYVLAPSFWGTPLLIFGHISDEKEIVLFGGRPAEISLIPGDVVPDALYQALKALADPTRLRILRYLTDEPRTPAELARLLRLRAPTVIHHLDALRLARLVVITLEVEGKRYAMRPDAVDAVDLMLRGFLAGSDE